MRYLDDIVKSLIITIAAGVFFGVLILIAGELNSKGVFDNRFLGLIILAASLTAIALGVAWSKIR